MDAKTHSLDAQGNMAVREHGDLIGKYTWNAENPEYFIHLDQGNFNEIPKTPELDDVFEGAQAKVSQRERAPPLSP